MASLNDVLFSVNPEKQSRMGKFSSPTRDAANLVLAASLSLCASPITVVLGEK